MARVAFCQDVLIEYMGFMSMAAVLKQQGHEVEVFFDDQTNQQAYLSQLKAYAPQVVGFSLLSPSVSWALELAPLIKKELGAVVILGNVAAILDPGLIHQPGVDALCLGEGEAPLLELCQRLDQGLPFDDIASLVVKNPQGIRKNPLGPLADLETLPFLDRSLYDKFPFFKNSPYLRLNLGRGCPYHCTFCTNAFLKRYYGGSYLRKMSPERAVAEVEHQVRRYRPKYLMFIDEVLWFSNGWLREFLRLYKERVGLKFVANYRWGPISEDEMRMLAEGGADAMILAVETGDQDKRTKVFRKNVKDQEVIRVADLMRKYGIKFCVSQFFGVPGDTIPGHLEQLKFYRRLRPTYLWTTFYQPYPGTALAEDELVKAYLPDTKDFGLTLHSEMYLDLPDKQRWLNLKKVYFLLAAFPTAAPLLVRLTRHRVPLLFDLLFMAHFTYYALLFEKVSARQLWHHFQQFTLLPALRKLRKGLPGLGAGRGPSAA